MKFYKYNNLFDRKLSNLKIEEKLISTINQYSFCIAERDVEFFDALRGSDVLLPDGVGIVWAAKMLEGVKVEKIAGEDLFFHFMDYLQERSGSCFFLGSSVNTLQLIEKRIRYEYPKIKVGTFSPPFKDAFDDTDSAEMIEHVNSFHPDVLFVGMTAPKQEKWAYKYKDKLNVAHICCIGAVFDFYAQTIKRPSSVWIKLNLEWLGRLIKEPRRMWTRYGKYGPVFVWIIFALKFGFHKR